MKKKFLLLSASLFAAVALASCDGTEKPQEEPVVDNGDNGTEDNNQGTNTGNENVNPVTNSDGDENQNNGDENQNNGDDNQNNGDENQNNGDENQNNGDENQNNGDENQNNGDDNQNNGDDNQNNGDENQNNGDENQNNGDDNQNTGDDNGNWNEKQDLDYVEHAAVPSTYTEQGNKKYYTVKTEQGVLFFDENKNLVTDTKELLLPRVSSEYAVKEIKEDGSIVLNVTRYEFVTRYNGRFAFNVTLGEKTYEVELPKWVEEIKDGQAYFVEDEFVTIVLKNGNFNDNLEAKVGALLTVTVIDTRFDTLIPVFNYLDSTDPVYVFGQDIKVTIDDAKMEEYENLYWDVLDAAKAGVKTDENSYVDAETYETLGAKYQEFIDSYYDALKNYRYANVLADANPTKEAITLKTKILTFVYNYEAWDQEIDIAMGASIYRYQFFEDMEDDEIDEYLEGLNPEATTEGNAYQVAMKEALDKQETGDATAYEALVEYVGYATKYANLEGYDDYLAYAYENVYGREYQYADTNTLAALISEYIVPIYNYSRAEFYNFRATSTKEDWNEFVGLVLDFYGNYFDYFESYSKEIGGKYEETFKNYFLDGNYFYSNIDNNNVTGYVGLLSKGQPMMFLGKDYQALGTFIHEFGHYNAKTTGGDFGSYDLAETQSQGNELLFYTYLTKQESISKISAQEFINYKVWDMTDSIIRGYLINEFEKFFYTTNLDELTQEKFEAKWVEICTEAGMDSYAQNTALLYNILCNYNGYYISYCTSAIASLELYANGLTDWDSAIASYTTIYEKHADDATFTSVLEDAGLYGVFSKEAYELIATAFPNVEFVTEEVASSEVE